MKQTSLALHYKKKKGVIIFKNKNLKCLGNKDFYPNISELEMSSYKTWEVICQLLVYLMNAGLKCRGLNLPFGRSLDNFLTVTNYN